MNDAEIAELRVELQSERKKLRALIEHQRDVINASFGATISIFDLLIQGLEDGGALDRRESS